MTAIAFITNAPAARRLHRFFWMHAEWWTVAFCCAAWSVMLLHSWQHRAHGIHHTMPFGEEFLHWMLMVAAMMLPLVLSPVRYAADCSFWERRHRAIAGFLIGYFATWVPLGFVAALLREQAWVHTYWLAAACFPAAGVWQLTPMRARALVDCHRRRQLAPEGWHADRDSVHLGIILGIACLGTCWPLMLACTFAGHGVVAMTGGLALGLTERRAFRPQKRAPVILLGTLALAGYYTVLALMN